MKNRFMYLVAVPLILLLTACNSTTNLTINQNDTYNLKTQFSRSKQLYADSKCDSFLPDLKKYTATPNVMVINKSTKQDLICEIDIKNQHISKASKPFVTIKHYGSSYEVKLDPIKGLDYLNKNASAFKLSISFPGPILDVKSDISATVEKNTVTWNDAKVLSNGFTVNGQDHQGMTQSLKWQIGFLVFVVLIFLLLFIYRDNDKVKPYHDKVKKILRKLKYALMYAFGVIASYVDLASIQEKHKKNVYQSKRTKKPVTTFDKPKMSKDPAKTTSDLQGSEASSEVVNENKTV